MIVRTYPFACEVCGRKTQGWAQIVSGRAVTLYSCPLAQAAEEKDREHLPDDAEENKPPPGFRLLKIGETVRPGDIIKTVGKGWQAQKPVRVCVGDCSIQTMADARTYARQE